MEGELLDWELVHGSDTESTDSIASEKKSGSSSVIDDGMILSDHFSADNLIGLPDQSLESGDSSRVDHGSEPQNPVDLGLDQSGDACVRNELRFSDSKIGNSGDGEVKLSDFDEKKDEEENEAVAELTDATNCFSESNDLEFESQSGTEVPIDDSSKSRFDSGGIELVSGDSVVVNGSEEIVSDSENEVVSAEAVEESGVDTVEAVAVNSGDDSKSKETVWWKMPFVLAKYCAFRIGPVWSVSMAAALMGFVLLGRRLYHMKKKAQSFHLKVTIDDKKMSRVMSQAARLNEVFTEVRRVPVIRPALPSPGAWPVLSLR